MACGLIDNIESSWDSLPQSIYQDAIERFQKLMQTTTIIVVLHGCNIVYVRDFQKYDKKNQIDI